MSAQNKITKTFTLPKLKADGSNWVLFQDSVELECAAHNLESHINGTGTTPVHPHPSVTSPTADEKAAIEDYEKALMRWTAGEATIRKGLSEAVPVTLYLTVRKETTAKKAWDGVVKHHQQKAQLIIVELRRKLQNERCDDKGDVRTHLAKLRQMREDLALMAEVVDDKNMRTIILGSLPTSYDPFLVSIAN